MWLIKSKSYSIYFSGDSGYGKHFTEIGTSFGKIDLAILECGQYDKRWKNIHMFPKEVIQVAKDLHAVLTLPVHWRMFNLAFHWDEPIRSVTKEANQAL
ncbi:MBL fold metallo-hydrolase [Gracilibacillus alcaliphilus]|uniref:MBL fold metallo-hydrolase n=1 Tax=Gracilibacillus alcaliphilus TaxID=1401441 RepID=UPI00195981E9|nr:L-ascorbate metabolism protein UlaG (beta-lactamase superfamily) [Gracilibacillus alcaliphilus]